MKTLLISNQPVLVDDKDYHAIQCYEWRISRGKVVRRCDGIHLARWVAETDREVIHANGNTYDCRLENLITRPRESIKRRSKRKGVFPIKNRWKVQIYANGKINYFGTRATLEEATKLYEEKKAELDKEYGVEEW